MAGTQAGWKLAIDEYIKSQGYTDVAAYFAVSHQPPGRRGKGVDLGSDRRADLLRRAPAERALAVHVAQHADPPRQQLPEPPTVHAARLRVEHVDAHLQQVGNDLLNHPVAVQHTCLPDWWTTSNISA